MFKNSPFLRRICFGLPCAVLLASFALLLALGGEVHADIHRVELKKEMDRGAKASFNATEQKEALAKAVLKEAEQILAGSLPKGRKRVVRDFLQEKVDAFVLSYSEQQYVEEEDTGVLSIEANVNTHTVKDYLKKWGTYYTAAGEWDYRLEVRGELDTDKELRLADLETMSGLRRERESLGPVFLLRPPEEEGGHWESLLMRGGEESVYLANNLDKLWLKTWSDFFSRKSVRMRVGRKMRLTASGWSTSTGMRHFNSVLEGWSAKLDKAVIQSLDFDTGGLSGTWTVYTLTPEGLRSELESYIPPRGLDFSLEVENATRSRGNQSSDKGGARVIVP
ncbi:MAG: hypothetical protein V5B78_06775 [Desulfohalobiaceae bacterium]